MTPRLHRSKSKNIYDLLIIFIVSLAGLGSLPFGYSYLQPIRVVSLLFLGIFIVFFSKNIIIKKSNIFYVYLTLSLFWIVYGLFSLIWTPDRLSGQKELLVITINLLSVYLLIILSYKSNNLFQSVTLGWILALIYGIPFALNELINNEHAVESLGQVETGGINSIKWIYSSTFFGNPNGYCAILSIISIFLFAQLLKKNLLIYNVIIIALLIFCSIINIFDSARLGIFLIILQFFIYILFQSKIKIIFLGSFLILFSFAALTFLEENFQFIYNDLISVTDTQSTSTYERSGLLLSGISLFTDSYGMGVGAGGFEMSIKECCARKTGGQINPHNVILEIGAQYGVITLFLFVLLLIICLSKYYIITEKAVRFTIFSFFVSIPLIGLMNSAFLEYNFFWTGIGSYIVITMKYGKNKANWKL